MLLHMCLHYSLLGVSMQMLYIHNCGMMYIEGSDRASSPCLSWQYIYDLLVRCLWVVAQHVST